MQVNDSVHSNRRTGKGNLFAGIDIGSSALHYIVLDRDGSVLYSPAPIMHFANPLGAMAEAWRDVLARFDRKTIRSTALTGSAAQSFPSVMAGALYVYDSVAIPKGAEVLAPQARHVFHIGAKDAYFFTLGATGGRQIIREWRTGTKCGGGSGMLIEKQCRRLFQGDVPSPELEDCGPAEDEPHRAAVAARNRRKLQDRVEEMFRRAEQEAARSTEPSEFLARCGVVVQSDLIHKQNEGATRVDNLAGLFRTVARNYVIDVLGSSEFGGAGGQGQAISTGGVFSNDLIRANLADLLGIPIVRPEHHHNIAAAGAALKALEEGNAFVLDLDQLAKVAEHSRQKRAFAPPLSASLARVRERSETLAAAIAPGTEVVLGIDGGSTTTKGAIVELQTGKLLDKLYIKTHGNPEESLKRVLRYLSRHKDNVIIKGVGATGSARKLYEKILLSKKKAQQLAEHGVTLADRITDEITCHALGVKHCNPEIDTIFEVGGQDMKFTCFSPDGTVKEAKMNYSCQAGSGQTLENMADVINLDVESTLQEAALQARRVPIIDSTCGVFMEMDENRLIAEGFGRDEIAAAILRGTAGSYYYKFVGGAQHVGSKCSAQGGPALGKAFLAALAQVTDGVVEAYPHREMFGAWGQALDIIRHIRQLEQQGRTHGTAFRGWEIVDMPFAKRKVACRDLFGERSCGIRDCQLEVFHIEDDEIITGGFCPLGNSEAVKKPKTNYVDRYHRIYEKHFKKQGCIQTELRSAEPTGPTVGIKRSMATLGEKGIWSAALFRKLGFYPVVSPRSNSEIAKIGVDNSRTEFCIARKLATGHAAVLNDDPAIEYLFNPSFIEQRRPERPDLKYCIYTESEGYVLNDVLSLDKMRQINPILHFGDLPLLVAEIRKEFARVGFSFNDRQIKNAIAYAESAENQFKSDLYAEGDRFLQRVEREGVKAYVGIGRDYVLLDPEASSNSGAMFSQVRGLDYIPQQFLEHKFLGLSIKEFVDNEFWVQSVKILKANLFVANHPNLFPIRMINFACGPDSLKIYQEENIQQAAAKPLLVLVTDAQTNNAPFVTRTEAHERVVNESRPVPVDATKLKGYSANSYNKRTWLIPYMGDASYMGAAGLNYFGISSQVLPTDTPRGYEVARKHISTEVCYPLKGVVGDAIGFLQEQIEKTSRQEVEDNYLVMLPTTSGPCRFGKYTELLQEFMRLEGLEKIPVVGPSSETDYIDIPLPEDLRPSDRMKMQQILFKGINASDLLEDILRRFRPYAADKAEADALKKERLEAVSAIVAAGADTDKMVGWGHDTVAMFQALPLAHRERFPLILYIGEIYMRQHDPYTDQVVRQLEDRQLEVVRDPITDWLLYVNRMNVRNNKRDVRLGLRSLDVGRAWRSSGQLGKSLLKSWYMNHVAEKLAAPFHEVLAGRHVLPHPMEIIEKLEREHEGHGNIEGESPLSTGIAYYFMHDLIRPHGDAYISGIFHVGPFTCMQEGVATAKIEAMMKEFRKKNPDLVFPIIHAFFGDSPNANLAAEIAVFREQCYQKRDLLRGRHGGSHPHEVRSYTPSRTSADAKASPAQR
ncbi:MAG: acyl-CoA dehydratase activase-related protein [Sedimentisphaerales bacterium]|jgi:activator of 2-hydroxyglutaryl-CoA dehydratase/predicted nucleotide-binding protein (sugar kinase/HSP70/actin superfamily)|nr:acyl-CoA dehydratase activase-related protein [Sedimentisphaerales bacterium]HNY78285.1 acyl-CoA dehydratase activase-related protein [Sedimentisphaerales bacterium]HOC61832.1 acyl-CoA dehydratase activase-related protein [Sedimentisphaerales bacterium]HOH64314.1 acyl-CoA dehydratase activase-related protein [Sedimentisphaerales bacterium]HPY49026.1 acyl-CoA dehydratase activase-related protein [Sedimentisphaerales bacterium]